MIATLGTQNTGNSLRLPNAKQIPRPKPTTIADEAKMRLRKRPPQAEGFTPVPNLSSEFQK